MQSELAAYHPAFVRENTRAAWDQSSRQRVEFNLPADPKIIGIKGGETDALEVQFSDGHVGKFDPPTRAGNLWASDLTCVPREVWGKSRKASRSATEVNTMLAPGGSLRFAWADLRDSSRARRLYIEAMHVHGIALVDGLPCENEAIIDFCKSMQGFISPSCYGQTFTIQSVDKPNNLAFSSDKVQMHTDLPYYSTPPSIQLFHCLQQAKVGGDSIWVDGLDCAATLFEEDPDAFKLLSELPLRFMDVTDDWHVSAKQPTFLLGYGKPDEQGLPDINRIHFNERARDSWRDWPLQGEDPADFYQALRKFEQIIEQRERYSHRVLLPGEMICTDNYRTLHSRASFTGARLFKGGYLNWDDLYARWRAVPCSGPFVCGRRMSDDQKEKAVPELSSRTAVMKSKL